MIIIKRPRQDGELLDKDYFSVFQFSPTSAETLKLYVSQIESPESCMSFHCWWRP